MGPIEPIVLLLSGRIAIPGETLLVGIAILGEGGIAMFALMPEIGSNEARC